MTKSIFDHNPSTWQELEEMVKQAFQEMGYKAERNSEVDTIRGKVKIDVYAVNDKTPIPTIILCECKHWNKPVEQSVVYSFRTICADIGAHYGLIISKKGFQSGAEETRGATNIHLLDFIQFQETFYNEWMKGVFNILSELSEKLNPILKMETPLLNKLSTDEKSTFLNNFFIKYSILFGEHRLSKYLTEGKNFPIVTADPRGDPDLLQRLTISTPRQLLEIAKEAASDACKHFGI